MVIFHSYVKLSEGTTTTKLHYTALYCASVRCTTLPYTRPHCTTPITPHYATTTTLHFADRDCTTLHTTLQYTTLQHTTTHSSTLHTTTTAATATATALHKLYNITTTTCNYNCATTLLCNYNDNYSTPHYIQQLL